LSNGYLGKQLLRNVDLGEGILTKILENCPEINPEWLLTGKGSTFTYDKVNILLDKVKIMDKSIRQLKSKKTK
jgi:hypothetical protein